MDVAELIAGQDRFALHERHLNHQMVRVLRTIGFDVDYVRAEGPYLFDPQGNRYLDLLSGWGVFALGRNHPAIIAALESVLRSNLAHLVQMDLSTLAGILAQRLAARTGLEKAFFCSSGTEAVETALKIARRSTNRSKVIYCERGFHGLTLGSLSVNGDEYFRDGFGDLLPGMIRVPFNDLPALERALAGNDVAAFIFEPIIGHGVFIPDDDYLPEAARLCRKHGALVIADEVQTGLGRTGRFLAVEHWGVEPDMVCLAKALSGGFIPSGAVMMRPKLFNALFDRMERAAVHGSTFSKNDLAMAAGIATLDVIDNEHLVENAERMGTALLAEFATLVDRFEFLHAVRGKGLMLALEFGRPKSLKLRTAWKLLESANEGLFCQMITIPLLKKHRILTQVAGSGLNVVKLLPPLIINDADRKWIADSVTDVIADSHQVPGSVWDLGKTLAGSALKARKAS
ncbi:MAG: aspartate aminotransferase family protein [Gammaproteobacteria bacterium]|nr:aspartate aminotransferase family protein [Gammaproteobacteria bacterium]